jgi:hypothetical protein
MKSTSLSPPRITQRQKSETVTISSAEPEKPDRNSLKDVFINLSA